MLLTEVTFSSARDSSGPSAIGERNALCFAGCLGLMQLPLVILKACGLQEEEGLQPLTLVPTPVVVVWI